MKKSFLSTLIFLVLSQAAFSQARDPEDPTAPPQSPSSPTAPETSQSSARDSRDSRYFSRGGVWLEPMILATREDTTIKTSQLPIINDDTSGSSTGYGVGLRLGGHLDDVFLLGADLRYAKTQMNDSFYEQADGNVYNLAPVVGVQTPYFGIRLLASYVVVGENDPNAGYRGLDLKFKEANGWRVGAGLYVAAVSLNLEYQDITYNSTEIQSFGAYTVNNATSVDANNRGYSLSLSFPVEM